MAKEVMKKLKLEIVGGQASPAPPLGPILGQEGINIGEFTNQFNDKTKEEFMGQLVRVSVNVYDDRSFDMEIRKSPTSFLIKKAAGIKSGSGKNLVSKAGTLTKAQVKEIAEEKMEDLNANDIEAAMKIVEGSARSMGVEIK